MKSEEREALLSELSTSRNQVKLIEEAIIQDKPWTARFLLDILIGKLQAIHEHTH